MRTHRTPAASLCATKKGQVRSGRQSGYPSDHTGVLFDSFLGQSLTSRRTIPILLSSAVAIPSRARLTRTATAEWPVV
jgi:hypothetical protein